MRLLLGTLMKANGEDVKTIQETLRHANFKVKMDVYTQGITAIGGPLTAGWCVRSWAHRRTKAMKSNDSFPQGEILIEPFQTHVFPARILQVIYFVGVPDGI